MADTDKSIYNLRYNQLTSNLEGFGGGSPQWTLLTLNNVDPQQVPVTRQINTTSPLQGGGIGHGQAHGALAVEREDLKLADVDVRLLQHLHVQAICKITYRGEGGRQAVGRGVLEQLVIGPHAPSGFTEMLDLAK